MGSRSKEQDRLLALLRSQHTFPGPYLFRVIVRPTDRAAILSAVSAVIGDGTTLIDVSERPSRGGSYVALHLRVQASGAEIILEIYDVLKRVDGVLAVM